MIDVKHSFMQCYKASRFGRGVGTDGNQLAVVTEQLNVPLVAIDDETILYDENGQEVDRNEDEKARSNFLVILATYTCLFVLHPHSPSYLCLEFPPVVWRSQSHLYSG